MKIGSWEGIFTASCADWTPTNNSGNLDQPRTGGNVEEWPAKWKRKEFEQAKKKSQEKKALAITVPQRWFGYALPCMHTMTLYTAGPGLAGTSKDKKPICGVPRPVGVVIEMVNQWWWQKMWFGLAGSFVCWYHEWDESDKVFFDGVKISASLFWLNVLNIHPYLLTHFNELRNHFKKLIFYQIYIHSSMVAIPLPKSQK